MNKIKIILLFLITLMILSAGNLRAEDKKPKTDKKPKKIKMKKVFVSLMSISYQLKELKADEEFYKETEVNSDIALRWFPIIKSVRDGELQRQGAIDSVNRFTNEIWEFLEVNVNKKKIEKYSDDKWVFPVKGYTPAAIGGRNGSGYIEAGFDFFGVNSGGHPAHDIFIADSDQDCIDDYTNEPVEILSMSGGIVIETRKDWTPDRTDIKGGNIVYVYDNYTNGLFYYAHLKEVTVNVGDLVIPGTSLGIMGRTGKNAYPSRSPTHLHLMYVRSFDGDLQPENIYNDLLKARLIP